MCVVDRRCRGLLAAAVLVLLVAAPAGGATGPAPGAPGQVATWTPGNKDGFGTSTTLASHVWLTLRRGALTEVYFPDLGTPSVRSLELVVSDGRTFTDRETQDATHVVRLVDARSLTYRQVSTAKSRRWRIVKTYVTDPARSAVLVDVRLTSLTGRPYRVYALFDPGLSNTGDDDRGRTVARGLVASDARNAVALRSHPAPLRVSSGYLGSSDGWTDLAGDHRMDWAYSSAEQPGNLVQTAQLPLNGVGRRAATVALGFGATRTQAVGTAAAALRTGFATTAPRYAAGWHRYLAGLRRPRSVAGLETLYDVSVMTLAGLEDKTFRGGAIASPSMAWVWGTIPGYSGPYHLVWSRDLYQAASAQLAAGDRGAAQRAVDFLWQRQQQPDGCFPQNSNLDGSPHWPNLQLDEVAYPVVLSWQLRRSDAATLQHVRSAIGCILARGPASQERWENAEGYSPATIAAEIAALVTGADLVQRAGDRATADAWRATADDWQAHVERWTATRTGPLSPQPYYLRLTKDGDGDSGATYTIGDGGPTIDQRAVVDPSFLELVRFGVKRPDDPTVLQTIPVVDRRLGVVTPNGQFWHRYDYDGYGETPDGGPFPGPGNTGRLWPIFAGERGEYELAAGHPAAARRRLRDLARTANDGLMLPEQVWDEHPPSGRPGFPPGQGTGSATPLGWTHAQFVRLAWSIDAGRPVERPSVVACRYAGPCG